MPDLHSHDCGCVTYWSDGAAHPMYSHACGTHRGAVPGGWLKPVRASKPRKPVKASA